MLSVVNVRLSSVVLLMLSSKLGSHLGRGGGEPRSKCSKQEEAATLAWLLRLGCSCTVDRYCRKVISSLVIRLHVDKANE